MTHASRPIDPSRAPTRVHRTVPPAAAYRDDCASQGAPTRLHVIERLGAASDALDPDEADTLPDEIPASALAPARRNVALSPPQAWASARTGSPHHLKPLPIIVQPISLTLERALLGFLFVLGVAILVAALKR